MAVRVKAAGHLRYKMPDKAGEMALDVQPGTRVLDLLDRLGLNKAQVWIVRVNGENVRPEHTLAGDDFVELFPLVGGG
jgi:sulfur carrier protein ThiS